MPYSTISNNSSFDRTEYSSTSIVKALDDFLQAYERMNDVVMVPSRLKDMDVTVHFEKGTTSPACKAAAATNMRKNGELVISNGKTEVTQVDLYSFYRMLTAVRQEVVTGPGTSSSSPKLRTSMSSRRSAPPTAPAAAPDAIDTEMMDVNSPDNDQSLKLAALFRQHLQGLFTVLHQMKTSADFLSQKYQEDICGANVNNANES